MHYRQGCSCFLLGIPFITTLYKLEDLQRFQEMCNLNSLLTVSNSPWKIGENGYKKLKFFDMYAPFSNCMYEYFTVIYFGGGEIVDPLTYYPLTL